MSLVVLKTQLNTIYSPSKLEPSENTSFCNSTIYTSYQQYWTKFFIDNMNTNLQKLYLQS